MQTKSIKEGPLPEIKTVLVQSNWQGLLMET